MYQRKRFSGFRLNSLLVDSILRTAERPLPAAYCFLLMLSNLGKLRQVCITTASYHCGDRNRSVGTYGLRHVIGITFDRFSAAQPESNLAQVSLLPVLNLAGDFANVGRRLVLKRALRLK
jgi:hypothetical protein